jgi:hypothetical protein
VKQFASRTECSFSCHKLKKCYLQRTFRINTIYLFLVGAIAESETFAVSFGCVVSPVFELTPSYEITTIFGFKGLLNKQVALLLRSMGCARDSLMDTALSQIDCSFLDCLTKPVFRSYPEILFGDLKESVDKLQVFLSFKLALLNFREYCFLL